MTATKEQIAALRQQAERLGYKLRVSHDGFLFSLLQDGRVADAGLTLQALATRLNAIERRRIEDAGRLP
jgi:hypothetical protein